MDGSFREAIAALEPKYRALMAMEPVRLSPLPPGVPDRGVYLFTEDSRHLYVGRSNRVRRRLQGHASNSHYTATLAFLMARVETGRIDASYRPRGSRSDLLRDAAFRKAFDAARQRIREMDIRYVEETEPVRQALLEIYVAVATKARHNSFENH